MREPNLEHLLRRIKKILAETALVAREFYNALQGLWLCLDLIRVIVNEIMKWWR